jgi:hypothetical protein
VPALVPVLVLLALVVALLPLLRVRWQAPAVM